MQSKREAVHKATFSHVRYNATLYNWIFCLHTKEGGRYFGALTDFPDAEENLKFLHAETPIYIGARPFRDGSYWLHFLHITSERGLYPAFPLRQMYFRSRKFRERMLQNPSYADGLKFTSPAIIGKNLSFPDSAQSSFSMESEVDILTGRLAGISSPKAKEAPTPRRPEPLFYELRVDRNYMEIRVELRQFEAFFETLRFRPPFFLAKEDRLKVVAQQDTSGRYDIIGLQNMEDGKIYVKHFGTITNGVRRLSHVFSFSAIVVLFSFLCFVFLDKEGIIFLQAFSGALFSVLGIYALSVEIRYRKVRSGKLNKNQRLAQKALDILGGGRLYKPRPEVTMI